MIVADDDFETFDVANDFVVAQQGLYCVALDAHVYTRVPEDRIQLNN